MIAGDYAKGNILLGLKLGNGSGSRVRIPERSSIAYDWMNQCFVCP